MVATLVRPATLQITAEDRNQIYYLLETWGPMTPDEVAAALKLDEAEVELYLAGQAGRGAFGYALGRYLTRL